MINLKDMESIFMKTVNIISVNIRMALIMVEVYYIIKMEV